MGQILRNFEFWCEKVDSIPNEILKNHERVMFKQILNEKTEIITVIKSMDLTGFIEKYQLFLQEGFITGMRLEKLKKVF